MRFALPACLVLLLAAPVLGEGEASAPGGKEIHFAEGTPLAEVLKAAREHLGLPLVWDDADKHVHTRRVGPVKLQEGTALDQLRAFLTVYEIVMLPVGPEATRQYAVADARRSSVLLRLQPERVTVTPETVATLRGQGGRFVRTTIPVEHVRDLRLIRNAMARLVTGGNIGSVVEAPEVRALIVTDFAPNVAAMWQLVKDMDVAPPARETRALKLAHGQAATMADVLARHFAAVARQAGPNQSQPRPQVTADARSNQILITGTAEEIQAVVEAVKLLDVPADADAGTK